MPSKKYFLVPYIAVFLFALLLWSLINHGDVVLLLNANRNGSLDFFFKYWTYLGDGISVAILFIILIIKNWRLGITFLGLAFAQLISSQGLKRLVFGSVPRPTRYFEGVVDLELIEGVSHHGSFSFPSGHTITAFATATFFAIVFRENKWVSISLLSAAILVALSRIYLLQHFFRDVLAGSLIGVSIAIMIYIAFDKYLFKGGLLKQ